MESTKAGTTSSSASAPSWDRPESLSSSNYSYNGAMGCLFGVFDTVPQDEVDEAIEYAKLQARELEQYKAGTMRARMVLHEACADLELVRSTVEHMGNGTPSVRARLHASTHMRPSPARPARDPACQFRGARQRCQLPALAAQAKVDKPVANVEHGSRRSARPRKMADIADLEATAKVRLPVLVSPRAALHTPEARFSLKRGLTKRSPLPFLPEQGLRDGLRQIKAAAKGGTSNGKEAEGGKDLEVSRKACTRAFTKPSPQPPP